MRRSFVWLRNGMFERSLPWTRQTSARTGFTGGKVSRYGHQNNARPWSFNEFPSQRPAKILAASLISSERPRVPMVLPFEKSYGRLVRPASQFPQSVIVDQINSFQRA